MANTVVAPVLIAAANNKWQVINIDGSAREKSERWQWRDRNQ